MTTPNRPPLSPAAQAVWNAAWQLSPVNCESHEDRRRQQIAAALRAAADQVVPEADTNRSPCREGCVIGAAPERIRRDLLAIAAELEAQP